jgi:alpha-ketoglutarate-dependent taurine dioxygenase
MTHPTIVKPTIPESDVVQLGAEIRNIRLSGELPDTAVAAINQLLLRHKVIFFRGQDHLDNAEQGRTSTQESFVPPR